MTDFTDIVNWAKNAYPPSNYDGFYDWLSDIEGDLRRSGHKPHKNWHQAVDQLRNYWDGTDIEEVDEREDYNDYYPPEPPKRKKQLVDFEKKQKQQEVYFTPDKIQEIKQQNPRAFELKPVQQKSTAEKFASAKRYRRR